MWAALDSLSFEHENLWEKMMTVDPSDRGLQKTSKESTGQHRPYMSLPGTARTPR